MMVKKWMDYQQFVCFTMEKLRKEKEVTTEIMQPIRRMAWMRNRRFLYDLRSTWVNRREHCLLLVTFENLALEQIS